MEDPGSEEAHRLRDTEIGQLLSIVSGMRLEAGLADAVGLHPARWCFFEYRNALNLVIQDPRLVGDGGLLETKLVLGIDSKAS